MPKRTISASEIVSDLRSGNSDNEIMEKYQLSARALESIFAKLVQANLVSQADLDARFNLAQGSVALEVYRCPSCDCVQLDRFDECPLCGVVVAKYKAKPASAPLPELPENAPIFVGAYKLSPSTDGKALLIEGLNPKLQRKLVDAVSNALKQRQSVSQ